MRRFCLFEPSRRREGPRRDTRSESRPRRALRPALDPCEGRRLLSTVASPQHLAMLGHHRGTGAVTSPPINPLAPYRVFKATITKGPDAGETFQGPLVLGVSGRIQVIGYFFPERGPRDVVVGTVFGGASALRVNLPGGAALELAGTGRLQRVRGGLPDGLSLVGQGNVSGPARNDTGTWETLAPSRLAGT